MDLTELETRLTVDGFPAPEATLVEGAICDGVNVVWGDVGHLSFSIDENEIRFLTLDGPENEGLLTHVAWAMGGWSDAPSSFVIPHAVVPYAFMRIGFEQDGGRMTADPSRLLEYGEWKLEDGEEPEWHKNLPDPPEPPPPPEPEPEPDPDADPDSSESGGPF